MSLPAVGQGAVAATGSDLSVNQSQAALKETFNRNQVHQNNLAMMQSDQAVRESIIKNLLEVTNAAKEKNEKIRL